MIRYASDVVNVYKQNYSEFKSKAKHSIAAKDRVTKANKVKVVSQDNIHWLMNNLDVLYEVPNSGIVIGGNRYLPYEMSSVQYERDYTIYENRVILGLLLKLTKQIQTNAVKINIWNTAYRYKQNIHAHHAPLFFNLPNPAANHAS